MGFVFSMPNLSMKENKHIFLVIYQIRVVFFSCVNLHKVSCTRFSFYGKSHFLENQNLVYTIYRLYTYKH